MYSNNYNNKALKTYSNLNGNIANRNSTQNAYSIIETESYLVLESLLPEAVSKMQILKPGKHSRKVTSRSA